MKKRVKLEQNEHCNHCNNFEWMGQPLPLEVEHKDGNNKNNERSYLEAICPNCHSLTSTWRGKNKPSKRLTQITPETIVALLEEHGTISKVLTHLDFAAKGTNYQTIKRIITNYKALTAVDDISEPSE